MKGIAKEKGESSDKCIGKVLKVCEKLKLSITKHDIDRAHRVGKDRNTMIVNFFSFQKKNCSLQSKKKV